MKAVVEGSKEGLAPRGDMKQQVWREHRRPNPGTATSSHPQDLTASGSFHGNTISIQSRTQRTFPVKHQRVHITSAVGQRPQQPQTTLGTMGPPWSNQQLYLQKHTVGLASTSCPSQVIFLVTFSTVLFEGANDSLQLLHHLGEM